MYIVQTLSLSKNEKINYERWISNRIEMCATILMKHLYPPVNPINPSKVFKQHHYYEIELESLI